MTYLRPDRSAENGVGDSLPEAVWERLERVLDGFENAWRRGERPDLEEYLADAAAERRVLLRELVQEDMEYRGRRGEMVRAETYLERFPELRDDPAVAAELSAGNGAVSPRAPDTPSSPRQTPRPQPPATPVATDFPQLPDYEVTGVLGRGGMGVVYQARHLPLNRPVALKMILAGDHAGPEERVRFRHEAEAVARLQHPNIVQVYEVGDHDGRPYVALEFVAGGSLAQQLAGTPQPPREAAQFAATLARAVHYAHQHGIIHRDLKPANILLAFSREPGASADITPGATSALAPGSRLNVCAPKVTDFGLAKRLDAAAEQTPSGAPMGTPSYMAPEQARNVRDIGPAADLYSLGAILYEMLTGRPPFRGAGILETLAQVRDEEPVPPRRFQRQLPRDLETICLKCLQKEPGRRYASAQALADDLARFLAGEPIQARPVGVWERGLKWARRRPLGAALVVVSLAALVGLVAGTALIDEKRREADHQAAAARAQEQQARANYERAERSYRLAHAAMAKLLGKLRADPRFQEGAWEDVRRTLLQAQLEFYTQFVEQRGDEPAFKAERAQAYLRLAEVTRELDGGARAFALAQEAQTLFTALARDSHDDVTYGAQRDKTQKLSALCLAEFDHLAARPTLLEESLAAVKVLATAHPDDVDYRKQQAVILNSLAIMESQNLHWEEAERLLKEARAIRQTLVDQFPDDPDLLFGLAKCQHNLGIVLFRISAGSSQALGEARRLMQSLIAKYPHKASYRAFLALVDFNLSGALWYGARPSAVEPLLREGLALAKLLVDKYPTVPGYRTTLVILQVRLADLMWRWGKADAAFALYTEAVKTIPPEQARESTYARALEYLIQAHAGQAACLGRFGRYREAVWEWERALELESYPGPFYLLNYAVALVQAGDHTQAAQAVETAVKHRKDSIILYTAAKVYAGSATLVEDGSPLAERYGARAVALIREGIAGEDYWAARLGRVFTWTIAEKRSPTAKRDSARVEPQPWQARAGRYGQFFMLLHEGSLEPIRQRKDFQELLREVRHQSASLLKPDASSAPSSEN